VETEENEQGQNANGDSIQNKGKETFLGIAVETRWNPAE
jgi:hypothetical protein